MSTTENLSQAHENVIDLMYHPKFVTRLAQHYVHLWFTEGVVAADVWQAETLGTFLNDMYVDSVNIEFYNRGM